MGRYDYWDRKALSNLTETKLFKKCLLTDIQNGSVFPAIRGKKIDFYHLGRKLFSYSKSGFRSNIAYVVAYQNTPKGEVAESDLADLKLCKSFFDGYEQILKNTALYAEPESKQVSRLWQKHSYCMRNSGPIVALDIELSLNANEEGKSDRIDLVLFNTISKVLRFYEVKTFQNREIRAFQGQVAVVAQVDRYNEQINRRSAELIAMYQQYVGIVNQLFDTTLPEPEGLCSKVDLLVCDYKTNEEMEFREKILPPILKADILCKSIGNAGNVSQKTLNKWWIH